MGYRDPAKNINQSLGAINTALAANQAKFDDVFATMRDAQNARTAQNEAFLEANKKAQAEGLDNFMDDYWSTVDTQEDALQKETGHGFSNYSHQQFEKIGEDLYKLGNCNTPDCNKKRRNIMRLAEKFSGVQGAFDVDQKAWTAGLEIEKGQPGSIDMRNTDPTASAFMQDGVSNNNANTTWDFNYETGDLNFHVKSDVDGKTYDLNADFYTQKRLKGTSFFNTTGDPVPVAEEVYNGLEKAYPDINVNDNTNPEELIKLKQARKQEIQAALDDPRTWQNTLKDQNYMRSVFPGLVDQVTMASQGEDGPMKDRALKILYGEDMVEGGEGEANQGLMEQMKAADANAELGPWVSDPDWPVRGKMDELAIFGFQLNAPEGFFLEDQVTDITKNPAFEDTDAYKLQKMKMAQQNRNNAADLALQKLKNAKGDEKKELQKQYAIQLNQELSLIPNTEEGDQMMVDLLKRQLPPNKVEDKNGNVTEVSKTITIDEDGEVLIDGSKTGIKKNKAIDNAKTGAWSSTANVGAIGAKNEVGGDYFETIKDLDGQVTLSATDLITKYSK